ASLSDLSYATARRRVLPQGSVVAPPPEVKAVSLRRGIITPNAGVVWPPPTVNGSIRKVGDINIGQSGIVEPSPQLPMHEQHTFTGLQVVPPAPSVQGAGNSGTGGSAMAMSIPPVVTSPSRPVIDNSRGPVENPRGQVTEEMAIRLIGLALALPSSSYFSNYEVFIAERRISKVASQLIKLVYVSLPYQRRLSEYGLNNSRVYKLRVSRDRTCDESLLQMTWPETD